MDEEYFWVFAGDVMVVDFTALFHVFHPAKYISLEYGDAQDERCGWRSNIPLVTMIDCVLSVLS